MNIEQTNIETPAVNSEEQAQVEVDNSEVQESEAKGSSTATELTSTEESKGEENESFFDPNNVPEELKPAYKQMQAAFTKKTQEAAEIRKQAETYREKAEAYGKYEQFIPIVEEMLQGQGKQQTSPEMVQLEAQLRSAGYSDEAIEMMKIGADFTLRQFNQTQAVDRLQSQIAEAGKVDPRLNDPSISYDIGEGQSITFGQMVEEIVMADSKWRQDPVSATKRAIAKVDALIGKAKSEGKQELSANAKAKATMFPKTNTSSQGSAKTGQAMSIQDAFREAKEELGL